MGLWELAFHRHPSEDDGWWDGEKIDLEQSPQVAAARRPPGKKSGQRMGGKLPAMGTTSKCGSERRSWKEMLSENLIRSACFYSFNHGVVHLQCEARNRPKRIIQLPKTLKLLEREKRRGARERMEYFASRLFKGDRDDAKWTRWCRDKRWDETVKILGRKKREKKKTGQEKIHGRISSLWWRGFIMGQRRVQKKRQTRWWLTFSRDEWRSEIFLMMSTCSCDST